MSTLLELVLVFLTSFAVTFFVIPQLSHIASKIEFLDYPNKRKVHSIPKPFVGGLAILIALSFSNLLFIPLTNLKGLYAGIFMLAIMGLLDDLKGLNPYVKFLAEILASVYMIYFGNSILLSFGDLLSFGPINLGLLAVPVTIFCVVGIINAINMTDGIDGLAGGFSLIAFISFAILSYINQQQELMLLSISMIGATAGFLRYNWRSKVFMGDSGSSSLGFALVFLAIAVTQKEKSLVPPIAPLLLLAVPIVDTVTVMIKRVLKRKSPFHGDKTHFHHTLVRFGFDKKRAVKIILSLSAVLSLAGIMGTVFQIPEYYLFSLFLVYAAFYVFLASYAKAILKMKLRFKKKTLEKNTESILTVKLSQVLDKVTRVKRKYERYTVYTSLPCCIKLNGDSIPGTVVDLGLGGFSASLKGAIGVGEEAEVSFPLVRQDEQEGHSLTTEVVWSMKSNGEYRNGFKFVEQKGFLNDMLKGYVGEMAGQKEVWGYEYRDEYHFKTK